MFSSSVTEKLVLDKLREAVKNGKFGDFSLNTSSIQGTQAIILHTNTLPFGIATQGPPDGKFTCLYNSNISNITLIDPSLFEDAVVIGFLEPLFFFLFSLPFLRRSKFMAECSNYIRLHTERKAP